METLQKASLDSFEASLENLQKQPLSTSEELADLQLRIQLLEQELNLQRIETKNDCNLTKRTWDYNFNTDSLH